MKLLKYRLLEPDRQGAGGGAASGTTNTGTGTSSSNSGAASGSAGSGSAGSSAGATGTTGGGNAGGSAASSGSAAASGASGQGSQGSSSSSSGAGASTGGTAAASGAGNTGAGDNWGADWRENYADKDDKKLGLLKRYDSPRAALDALFEARTVLATTRANVLPKDATPEQLATYRKDNGIPEKPEGYFEKLPDGVKLSDSDRAVLAPYAALMHELNLSPEAGTRFIAVRTQALNGLLQQQQENDTVMQRETEDVLRKEWGGEYRANTNNIATLLSGAPEGVRDALQNARAPDGSRLFNNPQTQQFFAQLAREMNPFGVVVGSDGGSLDQKGVEARIKEIEGPKFMGDSGSVYYKGPQAETIQKEYRTLIEARDRMRQKAA